MVDAAPFRGLRYDAAVAGDPGATSAPAYDDIDAFTYASHRASSPYTVLELLTPPDDAGSLRAAGEALRRWRRTGVLVQEPRAAFYRYEQHELAEGIPTVQRGVLAAVALEPPGGAILTHEAVDPQRVGDRRARLEALRADLSPIFALATGAPDELRTLLARPPVAPPVVALSDAAGVDHRVWAVTQPAEVAALRRALAQVQVLVADGHHRYAAALAARSGDARSPWQRTLMHVVDVTADRPEVLGVHRLVRGVGADALATLEAGFVLDDAPADPQALRRRLGAVRGPAFGLLLAPPLARGTRPAAALVRPRDEAALRARLPSGRAAAWYELDTALLDHGVLPLLGGHTVEHRPDLVGAASDVRASDDALLFLVRPVDAATAEALAALGEHMPPKSTYFRPKPRAGLVMRLLDEDPPSI